MKIWVDAHLSPKIARWLSQTFDVEAVAFGELKLLEAEDPDVFFAARTAAVVVMTKDRDFVDLVERHGPPPQVIWVTLGNTSNRALRQVLTTVFPEVLKLLRGGEPLIEISAAQHENIPPT